MFKLRAYSPTWAVAESEEAQIVAFVSYDETRAKVVFKKDDDPSIRLASAPVTVNISGLCDGTANACYPRQYTGDVVRLAREMSCANKENLQDAVLKSIREATQGLDNIVEISQNPFRDGMISRVFVDGDLAETHLLITWIVNGSLYIQDNDEVVFPEPFVIQANNRRNCYKAAARILSEVEG